MTANAKGIAFSTLLIMNKNSYSFYNDENKLHRSMTNASEKLMIRE